RTRLAAARQPCRAPPAKGVAEAAGRSDETRSSRVVPERLSDAVHRLGQRGLGDEDPGPDDVADLGPGQRPRTPLDEQAQQLEGLGLERDRPTPPKKLPTLLIELEIPERNRHGPRPGGDGILTGPRGLPNGR